MGDMGDSADAAQLQLTDFVANEQPSSFLKLTMSRRIKDKAIAEPTLVPFLLQLLQSSSEPLSSTSDTNPIVRRVLYGSGSRRVILLELSSVAAAQKLREMLHEKPCELLGRRPMYAEFAMPRNEQEARDRLLRVHNVQHNAEAPGLRVPGLRFEAEFITKEQEAACVAFFERENGAHWANTIRARQVQHFGYEFNYDTRRCDPDQPMKEPIPEVLQPIIDKIAQCGIMDGDKPDQITVNEYLPGQGIAFHLDTHSAFTTTIASLSICSEVVMDFRSLDGGRNEGVLLPARSLAVMSGASRYKWEHAIVPRTFDVIDGKQVTRQRRVSITFRKIRSGPCECRFPKYCDTPGRDGQEAVNDEERESAVEETTSLAPTALEQQYVHEFYETVAAHFSSTRHSPWPRVAQFVSSLPEGSMIADLGCGNGKYMKCVDAAQSFVVGGDRSSRLVKICRDRDLEAMVCDTLAVPLRSNSCDAALSIAVLHHLSTLSHRLAAVKELLRVLRVGGRGIIYAWAHEQMKGSRRRFEEGRQDFMVPWNLDKRFAFSTGDSSIDVEATENGQKNDQAQESQKRSSEEGDVSSDDNAEGRLSSKVQERVVVERYCHMFKKGELESLVALAGNAEVEESYYDESNWAVILRRVS
ncbi:Alkylated DNA repair protein alkB 8 [Phytophthora rubi]|uniref:Alkylated DNA repair protein alkB 8 n=1 Tax=Phytophthora rubi TaxID=129364 RepID=A0A6A3MFE7_9STRA|nr:Alkylated DNA repair protein alkB 8 [Phytophthora rubi]KAE9033131.1 Alkylated DNA repair protein alkB 8 [Phytophthora rubi]